jgi:predicted HD phosphohydrolase
MACPSQTPSPATNANYLGALSEASVGSMALQGGRMSAAEVAELERNPYFEAVVQLRQIDDRARDPSVTTSPFARLDFLFGD